ncbi:MAG: DNA polymerase IV [Betaproteobacteria bacterium]|nr:DNA polymerase IV [Betaproteobacteria bacterium]MDH5341576.1 DNA polymerase IV [Betaproteobacteria bacterium]
MSARYIAHLDMDAFYASVELLRYPQLRGMPVVVGGRRRAAQGEPDPGEFATLRGYSGRGVITTSTYEARALGVFSGMGLMKAAKLAPDAVLLPADFDAYRRYSRMFKDAVRAIAPLVEDRGIDEIYIDLTDLVADRAAEGAPDPWARVRAIATDIQRSVRETTQLSCSIGITPNKLLSKIASELNKPAGISVIRSDEVERLVWPLAVRKVNGIGPKANLKLEALGIRTVGELAHADVALLIAHFGQSYGAWMHAAAHGRDERPVVTYSEPKSISRETTFEDDLHAFRDKEKLTRIFTELCVRVAGDLQRKGYAGKTIGLKIRYDNFKTVTRDLTLAAPTQDAAAIRRAAGECLKRVPLDRRIRLLGVRVGALAKPGAAPDRVPGQQTLLSED